MAQAGLALGMITNGALLTGSRAESLANRMRWIRVSLDGWDDDSYARYRGIKSGAFSQLMENLKQFSAIKGNTQLGVAINLDADNVKHLESLVPRLKACGVEQVKLAGCVVADDAATNSAYHQPFFAQTKSVIQKLSERLRDETFQIIDRYHLWSEQTRTYSACGMISWLTVIAADLNVYSCQDKAYHASGWLGSLKDQRFAQAWFDPDLVERARALDPRRDCAHHCVSHQKHYFSRVAGSGSRPHRLCISLNRVENVIFGRPFGNLNNFYKMKSTGKLPIANFWLLCVRFFTCFFGQPNR